MHRALRAGCGRTRSTLAALELYNTMSGTLEPLTPVGAPALRMYACGPTVYDYGHIGNFRTFLPVAFPSLALSTDNAAMIAAAAWPKFLANDVAPEDLVATPQLKLG